MVLCSGGFSVMEIIESFLEEVSLGRCKGINQANGNAFLGEDYTHGVLTNSGKGASEPAAVT